MVELNPYYHVNAMRLAEEVHSLLNIDGQQYPDIDTIYDSIEDLCNSYFLKTEEKNIAYVNYNKLLMISDNCGFYTYKWLCKYIVKAIMKDNPTTLSMTDVFCIEF